MDKKLEFQQAGQIRTRFAPAPTGYLHPGGARTGLFNFLFAKKNKGKFILRIDDTDKLRSKKEFEDNILESLAWLGIEWDEGPDIGGPFGPYRQSERNEIYKAYLEKLIKEKKAYFCFCSAQELNAQKQYYLSIGKPAIYSGKCRTLLEKEVEKLQKEGKKSVIRLKTQPQKIKFHDLIRGDIEFDTSLIGDFIIAKDIQTPLYNFCSIIDDYEMKISHIIRGEEHLSNTPKQILILKSLDLEIPLFAHLPMILNEQREKLSKRKGSIPVLEYKKQGYLPEALINFLAFLGWNPGTEKEIYSLTQLISDFSLERVKKSAAVFYQKRLDFLNSYYIREKPVEEITKMAIPYLIEKNLIQPIFKATQTIPGVTAFDFNIEYEIVDSKERISFEKIKEMIALYQTRIKKLSELPEMIDFFFKKEIVFPLEILKWKNMNESDLINVFNILEEKLSEIDESQWERKYLFETLLSISDNLKNQFSNDRGYIFWPLRVALTGKQASAPPAEIMEILGKKKTLKRINDVKQILIKQMKQ